MSIVKCKHECTFDEEVEFDEVAAQGLSSEECRIRWPRKMSKCNQCGETTMRYASFAHYVYVDG